MASTFSDLKIQLMATGENSGTWGDVTNVNLGTAIEEAITGSANVAFSSADVTLPFINTNETQAARNLRLNLTGTSGGARNLIVPAIEKVYIINNGLADTVTVKNAAGTGIAVPTGKTMYVYNNGTNVVDAITHLTSLTLGSPLPVASGGTGSATAAFSGANITDLNASNVTSGTLNNARTTGAVANTANALVLRDASGNFNAGTITAALSGNAATATTATNQSGGTVNATNLSYTGTLTGGTGVINIGSGQVVKDANGNVGIGTTSPNTKLDVDGNIIARGGSGEGGQISLSNVAGGAGAFLDVNSTNDLRIFNNQNTSNIFYTNSIERARITSSGNVGIGTSSPNVSLQVNGGIRARGGIPGAGGVNNNGYAFDGNGGDQDSGMFSSANGQLEFYGNNTERLRIDASGNVGIGTSSPSEKVHVVGNILSTPSTWGISGTAFNYLGDTGNGISATFGGLTNVFGINGISFNSSGTERARIDSGGNFSITQSPGKYTIDTSGGATSIANNGTVDFPNASGLLIVNNYNNGHITVYIAGGAGIAVVANTFAQVGTFTFNVGVSGYTFTNNTGLTQTFGFFFVRTRATA